MILCDICYENINIDQYENHKNICLMEQQNILNNLLRQNKQTQTYISPILTQTQKMALDFAKKKSKIYSKNTKLEAFHRLKLKKYSKEDFDKILHYIQNNVIIIIHVNLDKVLEYLVEDDHYRNMFEVNKSGGSLNTSLRVDWENNLFKNIYNNADPSERVKYGALNLTNSSTAIKCCISYGDSFLVLKKEINERSTFVLGDSSCGQMHLATFKYCEILLALIPESLLDNVIDIVLGTKKTLPYDNREYIEVQIHGPLRLNHDIEVLVVNKKYENNNKIINLLNQFKLKHCCPYIFMP